MEKNTLKRRKLNYISGNTAVIGKMSGITLLQEDLVEIFTLDDLQNYRDYHVFYRLSKNHVVFDSKSYKRKRRTVSWAVKYMYNGELLVGIVEKFIKASKCNLRTCECGNCNERSDYYAIIHKCVVLEVILEDDDLDLLLLCKKSNNPMIAININDLERVCYFMENTEDPETFYVVDSVNNVEFD